MSWFFTVHVGKYTPYMDPMAKGNPPKCLDKLRWRVASTWWDLHNIEFLIVFCLLELNKNIQIIDRSRICAPMVNLWLCIESLLLNHHNETMPWCFFSFETSPPHAVKRQDLFACLAGPKNLYQTLFELHFTGSSQKCLPLKINIPKSVCTALWRYLKVKIDGEDTKTRWWFQRFLFSPLLRKMIQFDEHIFQMAWNHQLEKVG